MTYEEFRDVLLKKLEDKKQDLGYREVKYYEDGFTSQDPGELELIRSTNIRYNKPESDTLNGDYVFLVMENEYSIQLCRLELEYLYRSYNADGWEYVWTIINANLAAGRRYSRTELMDLLEKNEYTLLRDKIYIRPIPFNDHRYELKESVYRRIGDIALILYILVKDTDTDGYFTARLTKNMTESWEQPEDEIWDAAMLNTCTMSPPRIFFHPMDLKNPPYKKGTFMALNSDITSLPAMPVPILTTATVENGAVAMFYPGVKERIAELFGSDYYVLFTNVNGVQLFKKGSASPRMILSRIKAINKADANLLSRKIYLYELAAKELKML